MLEGKLTLVILIVVLNLGGFLWGKEGGGFAEAQWNEYKPAMGMGGLPEVIKIGGLFDGQESAEETAFKHAVEKFNREGSLTSGSRFKFSAQIQHVQPANSYAATQKVCGMMKEGIAAIIGPQTHETSSHVQSICDSFEMPHIETKWDHQLRKDNYLINLHPHPSTISRALNDLVDYFGWQKFAIIYENQEGLYMLQDLIKGSVPAKRKALIRQLPEEDYRGLFREILRESEIRCIVLDCQVGKLGEVLKQAQQVGLMTYQFSFILTTLDVHTMDLDDYKFSEANITAFRIVDPERPEVFSVVAERGSLSPSGAYAYGSGRSTAFGFDNGYTGVQPYGMAGMNTGNKENPLMIPTDLALIYDAVNLLGKALTVLDSSQKIEIRSLNCDSSDTWQHGYSVINYMKMVTMQGLTGLIQFNTTGFRTDVNLDVIQLKKQGMAKIGVWDSKFVTKFNWTKAESAEKEEDPLGMDLKNLTLTVTTFLTDPMTMWRLSDTPLTGNARYEGFAVDLLEHLAKELKFKYIIKPVDDGLYGKRDADGKWNGMIGEVMDGTAHIAVADLTINKERQEAVDFTMPFMNLGISILYVKPSVKPPSLFSFMLPFSLDVWIYMAFAFFGVSVILFILARLTPYEWDNPFPCIEEPEQLSNQFTLLNSFWFTIGSIMQQGSDIAPKAVSTRMIAGIWWFFTLIMVSSYTANLATFLIVEDLDESIKALEDLPKQTKVKYGCVLTGTTAAFFRNAPFPLHKQIMSNMEQMNAKHKVFVQKNSDGVDRVLKDHGGYAFFMESTAIEYTIERNCKLAQVGGLLDNKGYGIALPKGSKYRQAFSSGILRLQESGVLEDLKRKWWKEKRKENVCAARGDTDVKPLKLDNVGGVFVVLIGGCIMAIVFAVLEFMWKVRELALNEGESLGVEIWKELHFALACRGNVKQVRKKSSLSSNDNVTGNSSNKGSKSSLPYQYNTGVQNRSKSGNSNTVYM